MRARVTSNPEHHHERCLSKAEENVMRRLSELRIRAVIIPLLCMAGGAIGCASDDDEPTSAEATQTSSCHGGTCGSNAVVCNAGPDQHSVAPEQICFDGSGSSAASGIATMGWDLDGDGRIDRSGPTACIPCTKDGEGDVRLFVTDRCGCGASDTAHWKCVTNHPPICKDASASVDELWPPNHQYENVSITGVTDPDRDPVSIIITGIHQDEPVNGLGDGDTCPDGQGIGTSTARVRAERSGTPSVPGDGRVYHISFKASDGRGGVCTGDVTVCVPHDQRPSHTCVDEGSLYNSTICS
jgi:hypothetical protein